MHPVLDKRFIHVICIRLLNEHLQFARNAGTSQVHTYTHTHTHARTHAHAHTQWRNYRGSSYSRTASMAATLQANRYRQKFDYCLSVISYAYSMITSYSIL